jgi:hypothetical protein
MPNSPRLSRKKRHCNLAPETEFGDGRSPRGGEPPVLSNHFVKSISLTSCSTRTLATETLTTFSPWAIPATHSLPLMAASPWATASYNVAAVTSTVCDTPSMSLIVTRQDRIAIARKYHIRLFFAT